MGTAPPLKVDDPDTLNAYKSRLEAGGLEGIGPTNHTFYQSIVYFFDPNGHQLEPAVDTNTPELAASQKPKADDLLCGIIHR